MHVDAGNDVKPKAYIQIDHNSVTKNSTKTGNGPVDAIFKAVDAVVKKDALGIELMDYIVSAVTEGTDALGEVTVRIKKDKRVFVGHGANTDVLVASAEAYINAVNKFLAVSK